MCMWHCSQQGLKLWRPAVTRCLAADAENRRCARRQIITLSFLLTVLHVEVGFEHFGVRLREFRAALYF